MRGSAADALGKIGDKVAIPGLLKLLKDSNSNVRGSAADALGKIGDNAAIPGLLKLLKDYDWQVRKSVADALCKLDYKAAEAIPGLLKLLEYPDWYVHLTAAFALPLLKINEIVIPKIGEIAIPKIGDKAEIPGLLKLLEDSDWFVCKSVAYDLSEIAKQYKEKIAHHLPHLLTLIPSKSGKEVYSFILAIQDACQYYNYSIRQLSLTPEINKTKNSAGQTINIEKVGIINTGTVDVKGNQIGTQQNIHPKN